MKNNKKKIIVIVIIIIVFLLLACIGSAYAIVKILQNINKSVSESQKELTVPHEDAWGIYSLNLETNETALIYSSSEEIPYLHVNDSAGLFTFSQRIGGKTENHEEIFTLSTDGTTLNRLTNNEIRDLYPIPSPDASEIAFLRFNKTLDIYKMNVDGSDQRLIYDSTYHDSDINWVGDKIAFTRNSQIWIMDDDGSNARQVTNPKNAGVWGNANLPFGDYDPRISPDGEKIAFERLVDDTSKHGNYDIFIINKDGENERNLTQSGYAQGLASWSPSGDKLLYQLSAIEESGQFDMCMVDTNGQNYRNITPEYYPANFLCHSPLFSQDENLIYFVGEWYQM